MKRHHGDFTITVNRLGSEWHWTVEILNSGAIWTQGMARTEVAAWSAAKRAAERGHLEYALRGGRPRDKPRGEYTGLGRQVNFKPGQKHVITVGYSEAAMHLRMAGRTVPVKLSATGRSAQLYDERGRQVSFPITAGEAGIYHQNGRYYGYREEPAIHMAGAIQRMGQIARHQQAMREFDRQYAGAARRKPAASAHAARPHRHVHAGARR